MTATLRDFIFRVNLKFKLRLLSSFNCFAHLSHITAIQLYSYGYEVCILVLVARPYLAHREWKHGIQPSAQAHCSLELLQPRKRLRSIVMSMSVCVWLWARIFP